MPRFACRIDYDGTSFSGWQRQPKAITVQAEVEDTFSKLCGEAISIVGCGRTDAGVHAIGYLFHFDVSKNLIDLGQFMYKANKILPDSIVVQEIFAVSGDFHARFDALSRSYVYKMHLGKHAFLNHYSFAYPYRASDIDIDKLNEAAALLLGKHDFTPFCKTGSDVGTHFCTLTKSSWVQEDQRLEYHVSADRFLRGMIRLIVGMCLNHSRGKLQLDEVRSALQAGERLSLDWSVPGHGLTLKDIQYPI